ncbi:MAG: tRNA (adenosine(37)-N6)-dimethylallyltransferase MiaA [SAR324 cluster bacterium]|nr:tRNA (adenosine(37)-N6)-dimethylallyltransferase MiaA [SAR324 cluster bacterium]
MNHTPLPPLVAVVGPTASGKSALAMALAERLGGEVINTDSMQVYRGFDIGTGKLSQAERRRVTHHLIDVANPAEQYSAGRYIADARAAIAGMVERGRVPILCGGTGLYFRALLFGMAEIPQVSARVRDAVEAWLKQKGLAAGHAELTRVDPVTAAKVHPNDPARIARALEVYRMAGVPLSAYRRAQPFAESAPGALSVGTSFERPELYRRIGQRVRAMIARGWIEEVEGLLGQGYGPGLKPMRAIGYRQIAAWLGGGRLPEAGGEALAEAIATRTRRYAKRQMTWFRKHPGIFWSAPGGFDVMMKRVRRFLKNQGWDR